MGGCISRSLAVYASVVAAIGQSKDEQRCRSKKISVVVADCILNIAQINFPGAFIAKIAVAQVLP